MSVDLHKKKDELQQMLIVMWVKNLCRGMFTLATGVGKTRLGCLAISELVHQANEDSHDLIKINVMIGCSREKIRDQVWPDELRKWDIDDDELVNIERQCYASFANIKGQDYDLVILDEAHNLTEHSVEFFRNNYVRAVMILTATPPRDPERMKLLTSLAPHLFDYPLNQAVKDGLVAPYQITVVLTELEKEERDIVVKSKKGTFKFTEQQKYDFICKQVDEAKAHLGRMKQQLTDYHINLEEGNRQLTQKQLDELVADSSQWRNLKSAEKVHELKIFERNRFIYGLKSKAKAVRKVLDRVPQELKTIVFAGSIEQAESFCEHTFHSKKKTDTDLRKFMSGEVMRLACVDSLNEGMNIPDLDIALASKISSSDLVFIQRLGRLVRFKEGHLGSIWIFIACDTVEERWAASAMKTMDVDAITVIEEHQLEEYLVEKFGG